jgi:hypothetical protein
MGAKEGAEPPSEELHRLAKHLEISWQAVRKVLKGQTNSFSAENNARAAMFYGCDPDWLAIGKASTGLSLSAQQLGAMLDRVPAERREEAFWTCMGVIRQILREDGTPPPSTPTPPPRRSR